jgi:hypothetical protein
MDTQGSCLRFRASWNRCFGPESESDVLLFRARVQGTLSMT